MKFIRVLLLFTLSHFASAQNNIPIGTWRTHFSYNSVFEVVDAGSEVYVVAQSGLFVFDKTDNSLTTINKLNGLSEDRISALGFDQRNEQLIIGYFSGNLDVIRENEIIDLDLTSNSQVIGSKRINHITVAGSRAFIATDYGLLNFDLDKLEVTETYRQLGENAVEIRVNESTVNGDSIYLATEDGVIASNINSPINLFDPANWFRYPQSLVNGLAIDEIDVLENTVIAAKVDSGLYTLNNGQWEFQSRKLKGMKAVGNKLVLIQESELSAADQNLSFQSIDHPLITTPLDAYALEDGTVWIADQSNGLVSNISGEFQSIKPTGPNSNNVFALKQSSNDIISLQGGYSVSRLPQLIEGVTNNFRDGLWSNERIEASDLVDQLAFNGKNYYASFGLGVVEVSGQGQFLFNESNSTLRSASGGGMVYISALTNSAEGLWVVNYDAPRPLHLYDGSEWQSFSLTTSKIVDIINTRRHLWLVVDPLAQGGVIVFDKATTESRYLTNQSGNGSLPSNQVFSIDLDQDGLVWVGTSSGVAYFNDPATSLTNPIEAISPIFENRLLLRDEVITTIKIDPGNRKWIGTENGVWLFSENVTEQLLNFNTDNSPLSSNEIIDIEIEPSSGEVFFATADGIISYRADATTGGETHNNVKIFPNPITVDFMGQVGISGLADDVEVKITDANGQLIWQTRSAGGTATWNAMDYNGRRAGSGIYFVFSSTNDGEETYIGKIAVVN